MNIRALKKDALSSLKKNYLAKVLVAFIVTFDINAVLSVFSGEFIAPILKLHEFNFEAIKDYIITHNTPDSLTDAVISAVIILFEILFLSILKVGGTRYFVKSQTEEVKFTEIFFSFRGENKTYLHLAFVSVYKTVTVFLWGLLFIIPGIIKAYDYAAFHYVLALRPHISAKDALRLSKTMMRGNRLKFILLELSFIGWDIIEFVSFGILKHLFITPYKLITYDEFFTEIKNKGIENGIKELEILNSAE